MAIPDRLDLGAIFTDSRIQGHKEGKGGKGAFLAETQAPNSLIVRKRTDYHEDTSRHLECNSLLA